MKTPGSRLLSQGARILLWHTLVPALRLRARRRLPRLRPGGVTIVTVSWNSRRYLEVLLRLVSLRSPHGVEILVIDNNSSDEPVELVASVLNARMIKLPFNAGHDLALDIGFLTAETEFVVALDVDAFPLDGSWLERLLEPLSEGSTISGARLNRNYVHPCCLAMRTSRFVAQRRSFRSRYRARTPGRDASRDSGEEMSARESGHLTFFDPTSQRGPGDVGTVFGNLVYHNFYATRFDATTDLLIDGHVRRSDADSAWEEALSLYDR